MHQTTPALLKDFTTMRLGGPVQQVIEITTRELLAATIEQAQAENVPFFVLGGGSNVIGRDEGFPGLLLLNRIPGFTSIHDDSHTVVLKIGAGENWDNVVQRTVTMGLSGIEAMSAIPGTTGATPVQNVGAYGQEIADTLVELEAYDSQTNTFVTLKKADCEFAYRHSIFKSTANRRYFITSITLALRRRLPTPPFYASLQKYLDEHGTHHFTPQIIRDAVTAIRKEKLPDPSQIANTGSFFKNPIISASLFTQLRQHYPNIPGHEMPDNTYKVPAGWLIEQAGLKGYANHGMQTYSKNALVLVNIAATSYKDLAAFREEIIKTVHDTFHITLEQEPEEL